MGQISETVPAGRFVKPALRRGHLMLITASGSGGEERYVAGWIALAAASRGRSVVSVEIGAGSRPAAGPYSTEDSRGLAELVEDKVKGSRPVTRGGICHLALAADGSATTILSRLLEIVPDGAICIVSASPVAFRCLLDEGGVEPDSVVIRGDLPEERSVLGLAAAELAERGIRCKIWRTGSGGPRGFLSRCGVPVGGESRRLAEKFLSSLAPSADRRRARNGAVRLASAESGQALPLLMGSLVVLVLTALILVSIGGGATGKGRAQKAADLAAVSAARSLRDDLPRRLSPPVVNGVPNPHHLSRSAYLRRARSSAYRAGSANGVSPLRMVVTFPDWASPAPLRARVRLRATLTVEAGGEKGRAPVRVSATAAASVPLPGGAGTSFLGSADRGTAVASGGGYSGPLAIRQGKGMRPDVAEAFDQLSALAASAGHYLTITSAFRSDEEQARLFAANPDPRWVAPPGQSLHRCATELDLGPSSAYDWLAANAPAFGFIKRYSWEPWHFGFGLGPPPCSGGGSATAVQSTPDGRLTSAGVPSFVPSEFRSMISRAAAEWNVSAALLAAQLQAESNFNPNVVSSAGAQGIAQFMPGTAASYGLDDPFDPGQAIMAQAEMMSDLLSQFGSTELALAAYNAGPGAVGGCNCIPNYPETISYVEKITSLLAGLGEGLHVPLEVRLVK